MTDEDAFHAALDANPADYVLRLVFADWLDERGDDRGPGYRAMGEMRLRPYRHEGSPPWDSVRDDCDAWCWWSHEPTVDTEYCVLPAVWLAKVRSKNVYMDNGDEAVTSKDFFNRRSAEDAVARAFARLSPADQAAVFAAAPTPPPFTPTASARR